MLSLSDRYALFQQMETAVYPLYFHHYRLLDGDLHFLDSNCPDEHMFSAFFIEAGVRTEVIAHASKDISMLFLSGHSGSMWGVVFHRTDPEVRPSNDPANAPTEIFLLGPAFSFSHSIQDLENGIQRDPRRRHAYPDLSTAVSFRKRLTEELQRLPVISRKEFFHELIRLNACINQTALHFSDIVLAHSEAEESGPSSSNDYRRLWALEREFFGKIQNGDPNYRDVEDQAHTASHGVIIRRAESKLQAQFSGVTLAALASRAAIDGGVSPGEAYGLQNRYLDQLAEMETIAEGAAIARRMYADFIDLVRRRREQSDLSPQVRQCVEYLNRHFAEKVRMEDVAKQLGYAPYYLSRCFTEEMGMSVSDYLRKQRIERAKVLLRSTNDSVDEIAAQLQFSSGSYLARVFKQVEGVSPTEYRKQN